jgi:hypothetical protein
MEDLLFYLLLATAILYLGQTFIYGFQEHNRPTILFGTVFLFLAFSFKKDLAWINWALILVPLTGFVAALTGFSESLKPNCLNYLMMLLNLSLLILGMLKMF